MAEVTPEERVQKVKADLLENLDFEPSQVRQFFTTNIFGRALAHLVGYTGTKSKMLRCTSAGELKTAPTTTGIEMYEVSSGTAADAWSGAYAFAEIASRIDIFVWDNPLDIQIWKATETWGSAIEVPVGFYSVEIRVPKFRIKNHNAGSDARYQIIGWW